MARRILVAIALMLGAANAAQAIECHALPDLAIRGNWAWQVVDAKFCWYLGDWSVPKEQLQWPAAEQDQPAKQPQPAKKYVGLPAGQKIECKAQIDKTKPGHWIWRTIDNRQCWFVGERDTPRELLRWPPQEQVELRKQFDELPERPELRKQFDELPEPPESPKDVKTMPQLTEQPAEAAPESVAGWQIVNQPSSGDLEFIAQDAWIAFMSIDLNIGAEYLTDVPVTHWPLLAERTPQLDRIAAAAKQSGSSLGY